MAGMPAVTARRTAAGGFHAPFRRCPWCGAEPLGPHLRVGEYRIDRCARCTVALINPQPDARRLAQSYGCGYHATRAGSREERAHLAWKERDFRRAWPHLKHLRGGRLLDVGCGIGGLLYAARARGFHVLGIELSAEAARHARERFALDVLQGDLLDHRFPARSFSVITLYHVLEHLRDPARALREALRLLAPGGMLVIECPDWSSWSARHFKERWFHLEVPRHLFHFPAAALDARLREIGLHVAARASHHPAHGAASFYGSLYPVEPGLGLLECLRRRAVVGAVRCVARPLARAESILGRGSIIWRVAEKGS